MTDRTRMNVVKIAVRRHALALGEFSVADLVIATGLNPESVRTELQRMKKEGLITSRRSPEKSTKRGGRSSLYRLTNDSEARLALSESIDSFIHIQDLSEKPTSRYYFSAVDLLDEALSDETKRGHLLRQAENHIEMAEQAEGGDLASDSVKSYLRYERARLAYLSGQCDEAEGCLRSLNIFFEDTHNQIMIQNINEFLWCIDAWNRCKPVTPGDEIRKSEWAISLLSVLAEVNYRSSSVLTLVILDLLRSFSRTPKMELITEALRVSLSETRNRERPPRISALHIPDKYSTYSTEDQDSEAKSLGQGSRTKEDAALPITDWHRTAKDSY